MKRRNHFSIWSRPLAWCPMPEHLVFVSMHGLQLQHTQGAASRFLCAIWCRGCPLAVTTNTIQLKKQRGSMLPPLHEVVLRGWKPQRHEQVLSSTAGILNLDLGGWAGGEGEESVKQVMGP